MSGTGIDEAARIAALRDAQTKATELFDEISARGLVRPGASERAVSDEIRDLANDMYGFTKHWHKRIVRTGPNTLNTARENPPDRIIADDDIAFVDLGPVFEDWEADFARTYVLGDDPVKLALQRDLPILWQRGRDHFHASPDITGAELFDHVVAISEEAGWHFGGIIAGHFVGEFPHEKIKGHEIDSYVAPGSDLPMRRRDRQGRMCHWILEVHIVDPTRSFGAFQEQLLDI